MGVGLSDGTSYQDSDEWLATSSTPYRGANLGPLSPEGDPKGTSSTTSRMPLGASTEPAGALKSQGGTGTPGNGQKVEYPTPDYLNPPEGNPIQNYFKGREETIMGIPDAIRNIPEDWVRDQKKRQEMTPEEHLDEAINVGLGAGPGTMAGVKSISNLTGAAKSEALSNLGHAQVLEANGEHPDVVHQKTGFFRGADSRWRFEVDDSKSVFNENFHEDPSIAKGNNWNESKTAQLKDVLDHPDLYKAYPHLKGVQVVYDPTYKGVAGWNNSNTITMGERAFTEHDPKGTLMHEVQHAIQDEEGFAKGGMPGKAELDYKLKHGDKTPELQEAKALFMKLHTKLNTEGIGSLTDAEVKDYIRTAEIGKVYKRYKEAADREAFTNYEKLAGETESRNVETRMLMTAEERAKLHPRWTEDYNARDQIVRNKSMAASAYGVWDPILKKYTTRKEDPINFRRAANDNVKGLYDSAGNLESGFDIDAAWKQMSDKFNRGNAIMDEMNELSTILGKRNWNDIEAAKYKKLAAEHQKLFPPD